MTSDKVFLVIHTTAFNCFKKAIATPVIPDCTCQRPRRCWRCAVGQRTCSSPAWSSTGSSPLGRSGSQSGCPNKCSPPVESTCLREKPRRMKNSRENLLHQAPLHLNILTGGTLDTLFGFVCVFTDQLQTVFPSITHIIYDALRTNLRKLQGSMAMLPFSIKEAATAASFTC